MLRALMDERTLLAIAMGLHAPDVRGWSDAEQAVTSDLPEAAGSVLRDVRRLVRAGEDPLGECFCALRSRDVRRLQGATYTPPKIVKAMIAWAERQGVPSRVVEPGAGSGRFAVSAGRAFPHARLLAVELDPVAAVLCRAHLAAAGMAKRSCVVLGDYREFSPAPLPEGDRTLFVGNPPYVRHHLIGRQWKDWLVREGKRWGLHTSALAGLHVHFFLATANAARAGDWGCFITSAEWLDVNYGRMVRELLLNGLGARRLLVVEPTAEPFPDAQTTAAIACMEMGAKPKSIVVKRVASCGDLDDLRGGRRVRRERLEAERRWSRLTQARRGTPAGFVQLGELCRVHRGQVTGANAVWIAGLHSRGLPESVLFPTVTRARELYAARPELRDAASLRRVIDLPANLDAFDRDERGMIDEFLRLAMSMDVHLGYVASHRRPWWSVGLREPAPVLATYMARRPPAFVLNRSGARHLNIAHGLYPRDALGPDVLTKLVAYLSTNVALGDGRTYAGGLTKFEPREMERLVVPEPAALAAGAIP